MILILDAHALLWALADDPALVPTSRTAIADPANDVVVSAASVWELEIKRAQGRLRLPEDLLTAIDEVGISVIPITGVDAVRASGLPPHHRDPFDRLLIAQARRIDAVIVSRDAAFEAYDVAILQA